VNAPPTTLVSERILVFVSSRIGECKAERDIARDAIASLNHVPILFEDVGARPYAPRDVYEPRLRTSQIFVGIYRDGYGEIAPGMSLSGLEDEFLIAREVGMPRLIYVHRSASRDARLTELIEQAKNDNLTICYYDDPTELNERFRNDVTAVVARSFHPSRQIMSASPESAAQFLDRLVPGAERLARAAVEQALVETLQLHKIVEVCGELGVGKTILLVSAAVQRGWVVVNAQGNSPTQIVARISNELRAKIGDPPIIVESYDAALAALRHSWPRATGTVVAIDACPDAKIVDDIAACVGAPSDNHPLLFSLGGPAESSGFHQFRVPAMSGDEVAELWLRRFGSRPSSDDLDRLMELSKGLPLYLRYVRAPSDMEIKDAALEAIELRRFQMLPPLARDIVIYVCLSERALALDELIILTGERQLITALEQASVLAVENAEGLVPVHRHLQATIRSQLEHVPARHAYYATALGKHLAESGDFSSAFLVFDRAGVEDASRIIARASFDAARQGDFRRLSKILQRRIELLQHDGESRELASVIFSLAQAEDAAGDVDAARKQWDKAKTMAEHLGDADLGLQIRASYVSREALSVASLDSVRELESLRDELLRADARWLAANVALDLSTIFIRIGKERAAAFNADVAVKTFASVGDAYGSDLARRNFAAALIQIPGREDEANKLLEEFTQADTSGSKRLQAFKCNLLFMAARRRGDNNTARALAIEALGIGEELSDVWVTIANTINLANVERDLGRSKEAVRLYDKVAQIAQNARLRITEGVASRHAAEVNNRVKEFQLAKNYADHAAALLRDSAATVEFSIALEQRAEAESGLGDKLTAARTYLEAAKALVDAEEKDRRTRLISRGAAEYFEIGAQDKYLADLREFYGLGENDLISTALALADKLSRELPSPGIFGALNAHFRLLFRDAPLPISRRVVRIVTRQILTACSQDDRVSLALLPLLSTAPPDVLDLEMLVEIADGLNGAVSDLQFKPSGDLALNYVATLSLGRPVVVSLMQLDDLPETATVATIIALFLLGFEEEILGEILGGKPPQRTEVNVSVIALSEAAAANVPLQLEDRSYGVTRPTKFEENVPTFVVFRDGLIGKAEEGNPAEGLPGLLASVLLEVTFQLLGAEVDSDTLRRNIVRIVRRVL